LFGGNKDNVLTVKFARSEQKGVPESYLRKVFDFHCSSMFKERVKYCRLIAN